MTGQSAAHQLTDRIRQTSDILDVVSAYVTLQRALPISQRENPVLSRIAR